MTLIKRMEIKSRLATLKYETDKEFEHITVEPQLCEKCPHSFCTFACPAQCFQRIDQKLVFKYEDCVECGTCDIACDQGSVKWNMPRGPFGIRHAFG